jgi:hypothetical protein
MSRLDEIKVEWTKTYEMGDPGMVVSGHDWVGGWRRKRRRKRRRLDQWGKLRLYRAVDARDETNRRVAFV